MTAGAIRAPFIMPLRAPLPGVPKNNIDTKTKIEIKSETPGVDIFFTVNGTKPDWNLKSRHNATYLYKSPFRLPGGKQTVKAMAVDRERTRESNVVTKQFEVDILQDDEPVDAIGTDSYGFIDDMDTSLPTGLSKDAREAARSYIRKLLKDDAWGEKTRSPSPPRSSPQRKHPKEPMIGDSSDFRPSDRGQGRFLQSRLGPTSDSMANSRPLGVDESIQTRRGPPETATQAMRVQRETDFLKCVYCFAPRPADPYARFCNSCGQAVPPLPQSRLPPPEAGQMGMCVHCRSLVPFNVPTCLVCEKPMAAQNQPQASQRLRDRLLCSVCGTANPASLDSCVTCEARLAEKARPIHVDEVAPPLPSMPPCADSGPRMLSCTQCGRVNNCDARFCDWCGAKPQPALSKLICPKCSSHNHPYARFCGTCGLMMEPPPRQTAAGPNTTAQWMPLSIPITGQSAAAGDQMAAMGGTRTGEAPMWAKFRSTAPSNSVATQTIGIFYPSGTEMKQREDEEEARKRLEREMRDRAPLLTAVSPGRGYWRKQMDHIIAHLKAYAANDAEFRTLIGEPRMGKLLSAEVHEDGYELNLSITFALKEYKDPYRGAPVNAGQYLSSLTQGRSMGIASYRSDDLDSIGSSSRRRGVSTGRTRPKKKRATKKANKDKEEVTSIQDKALIREVGKKGEGRSNEVQQLVDEGADPNCKNKDGVPVLIIAVRNRHKEAIPALVQCGADVNVKGPEKGNSPLHEAVAMGLDGEDVLCALLGCGANPKRKNDRGDSPYDLAVRSKCDPLIKRLAAKMGQSQLNRMLQPQQEHKDDEF